MREVDGTAFLFAVFSTQEKDYDKQKYPRVLKTKLIHLLPAQKGYSI
jgi:hypothetical protein